MKLPQLTLRDLFWLVLVCALGIGWWVDQDRLRRDRQQLTAEQERFWKGAQVVQDHQLKVLEATADIAEAEVANAQAANRRFAGVVPTTELRRLEANAKAARSKAEEARATLELAQPVGS